MLLFLILAASGCGGQAGRFVTTGDNSTAFSSNVGCLDVVTGYETEPAQATGTVNDQNLLYVAIITPAIQQHGSASSSDYARYVTTLTHSWNVESGTFTISIPWDRQKDTVTIGNREFKRIDGNIFLVEIGTNGVSGKQFASLGPHVRLEDVIQSIRQQLPNDELVASMRLEK
jgi:hypothetical protein